MNYTAESNEIVKLGELAYFLLTLWAMRLGGRPASAEALESQTGLSAYKVRAGLAKLQAAGYVIQAGRVYQLSGQVAQLGFFGAQLEPVIDGQIEGAFVDVDSPQDTAATPPPVDNSPVSVDNSEKKFFSPIIINGDDINTESLKDNNNSDEKIFSPPDDPSEGDAALIQALRDAGIRVNVRTRRLLGRLTPEQVTAEWRKLRDYGRQGETGLLITILEGVADRNDRRNPVNGYADWVQ